MTKLREPTCYGCPHDLHYDRSDPTKQFGVTMHLGERFCTCGKRAWRFRRGDPKSKVPAWCPKRKEPRELRIYAFKDPESWLLHEQLCQSLGEKMGPEGHRYAVSRELTTQLSAKTFLERCELETDADLLGTAVELHHVVEIDDGLLPAYFYKTTDGYRYEPFFDAARARTNKLNYSEDSI